MSSEPQPPLASTSEKATPNWTILVVDDEKDVHEVSLLALKRRTWRRRQFELISAYSARQAQEILAAGPPNRFQVALVDIVMETKTAGLELCRHIRSDYPHSLRIILRTGQPGVAPEEKVINDYDIDYYMAKPEVTPEKLYATVRSCLRSSQDIDTLLAFSRQLRNFTSALQSITTDADLVLFMHEGLRFLELKHQVRVSFVKNIDEPMDGAVRKAGYDAIRRAHELKIELGKMHSAAAVGLDAAQLLLFRVQPEGSEHSVRGGFLVDLAQSAFTIHALQSDLTLFMQNWTIAHSALLLQQRVAREKMLNERMYVERIEGIANMVTGVAHEINTPLGVANTANGMIVSLAEEIGQTPPGPQFDALVGDLKESTGLLAKNLDRASQLIRSFKQLSVSQLTDDRTNADIAAVVRDCVDAMSVETKKRQLTIKTHWPADAKFPWTGYPGHLSQVLINLMTNTMRYAYKDGGVAEIRVTEKPDNYRLEFEDHGAGVAPEVLPRIFQPFVTSGRDLGGTGLGLAITHNIMTNLLRGDISVETAVGKGTKFVLTIPRVVPE
jgi:signal transduction histidine kinase/CheY-like chemotaxis protein